MAKTTCEESHKLDTQFLLKHGYLQDIPRYGSINWSCRGEPTGSVSIYVYPQEGFIKFSYTQTNRWDGTKTDFDYTVRLVTSPCYFGGKRWWFRCPLLINGLPCSRRVGVLYLAGKYFGCRKCYDLAYQSQQETRSGLYGLMGKVFRRDEDEYIRYKFWRGQPTKRYLRHLHKLDRGFTEADLTELNRRLGIR
ncbi:MAG: hypothetical protein ACD_48C00479G0005 [uncultured bacterium]|nr:MAG: hypothetical protein ACD_48C00479G0005 [uncultured bacterium]